MQQQQQQQQSPEDTLRAMHERVVAAQQLEELEGVVHECQLMEVAPLVEPTVRADILTLQLYALLLSADYTEALRLISRNGITSSLATVATLLSQNSMVETMKLVLFESDPLAVKLTETLRSRAAFQVLESYETIRVDFCAQLLGLPTENICQYLELQYGSPVEQRGDFVCLDKVTSEMSPKFQKAGASGGMLTEISSSAAPKLQQLTQLITFLEESKVAAV